MRNKLGVAEPWKDSPKTTAFRNKDKVVWQVADTVWVPALTKYGRETAPWCNGILDSTSKQLA